VVEDDEIILDLIETMLRGIGIGRVTRATSGSEAFSKIAKTERVVDCILCDHTMSPGNGLQLLQAIRTGKIKNLRPDSCFVLVTGSADTGTVKAAADLDVSGYLVKPPTPEKLRAAITKARSRAIALDMDRYNAVQVPL
jgi:CheY-like chemotaxis protein